MSTTTNTNPFTRGTRVRITEAAGPELAGRLGQIIEPMNATYGGALGYVVAIDNAARATWFTPEEMEVAK